MTRKTIKRPSVFPQSFLKRVSLKDKPLLVKSQSRKLADKFERIWQALNGPKLQNEFKFHPERKYLMDYFHKESGVCIELNGGTWCKGNSGHSSGKGIARDAEKSNLAQGLGFVVITLTGEMITVAWCKFIMDLIERKSK